MLTASANTIATVTRGEIVAGRPEVMGNGLVVDSREAAPGCIFVALPGEHADGHDFVSAAIGGGARVAVVSRRAGEFLSDADVTTPKGVAIIRVADTLAAIQELAAWHRRRLPASVVGVTGSTGKTTTKDFLTAALRSKLRVVATRGNRNNELGVPLTIFEAGTDTDVLIVEMGMRGLGQIARLAEIAAPQIGLVTNVGSSHIELLGTHDAVATAKGELVRAVAASGAVFLNGDDAYSEVLALDAVAPVTYYGLSEGCAVLADDVTIDVFSKASFSLVWGDQRASVSLPVPGRHNVYNALAAAAIALHLGVSIEQVAEGLASAQMSGMRMQTFQTASGVTVINDAYNANPSSMRAAVDTLSSMDAAGRRIAVLGDMAELGTLSELAHFEMGELVAQSAIQVLVTVGERARRIADGASAAGQSRADVRPCASREEASEVLDDMLEPGDVVLVKASRVMGLETIVEGIVNPRAG